MAKWLTAVNAGVNPAEVIQDTWGHLIPKPDVYRGYARVAQGQQDTIIMDTKFPEVHNPLDFYDFSEHLMAPDRGIGVYDLIIEMTVRVELIHLDDEDKMCYIENGEDIPEPEQKRIVEYKTISEIQIIGEME